MKTDKQSTLGDILKRNKISVVDLAKECGMDRGYIGEYIKDPDNWKGSSAAVTKMIDATERILVEREKVRQQNLSRLARLENEYLTNE